MGRRQATPVRTNGRGSIGVRTMRRQQEIFLVHGRDQAARETAARCLERGDFTPVILDEKPSGGRTIIEKLEHYTDVEFAVVLLTPDDVGAAATNPTALQPRARQNVIAELGLLVGKLGRSRVCALYKGPLELPSDIHGVVYVEMDDAGGWRARLARELINAGFNVNVSGMVLVD